MLSNKWWHGKSPLKIPCHLAFSFYRPRNSRLENWTGPKRSQVIEGQGSLSQDKTSLPSYHLMLSSYHTAPVQSQMEMARDGYLSLQKKRHDFLVDVVSSHSTIHPCQSLTQWGLVWPLHSKCDTDSKHWGSNQGQQRANMLRKVNNSPGCVCVKTRNSNALWSEQTNPFHQAPGGYGLPWWLSR